MQSKNIHIKNLKGKTGPLYKFAVVSFKLGSKKPHFTGIQQVLTGKIRVKRTRIKSAEFQKTGKKQSNKRQNITRITVGTVLM